MARETIFPTTEPRTGPKGEIDVRTVPQVRWTRDCMDVQIGLVPEIDPEGFDGDRMFTMILERGQINRLIATLRRARDAAYGKDE